MLKFFGKVQRDSDNSAKRLDLVKKDGIYKSSEDTGILINYQKSTVCHSQSQGYAPAPNTTRNGENGIIIK